MTGIVASFVGGSYGLPVTPTVEYLVLGESGVGGMFDVGDGTPWPKDAIRVGIIKPDATGDFLEFPDVATFQAYLEKVGANWTQADPAQPDPAQPDNPEATVSFDPVAAANWVWERKIALDNA